MTVSVTRASINLEGDLGSGLQDRQVAFGVKVVVNVQFGQSGDVSKDEPGRQTLGVGAPLRGLHREPMVGDVGGLRPQPEAVAQVSQPS